MLAYVDSDDLKGVNDREGHASGDALLRNLVALLRSKLVERADAALLESRGWR